MINAKMHGANPEEVKQNNSIGESQNILKSFMSDGSKFINLNGKGSGRVPTSPQI